MIPRADFIVDHVTEEIVFIIDEDDGGMSITNDAEAVCAFLHNRYPGRRIVYRDTMGQWDELGHKDGVFTDFLPYRR